ncbi:YopX family protein [Psychrobacter cibarius]|nr:YopX family protein [Psychrobacter cibarius]
MISPEELLTIHNNRKLNESLVSDEVFSFMQFTGLKDKNGVEIYEGDILEEGDQRFLVVFDSAWARFKLQHSKVIQNPEWNRGVKMPVIGNIHQNPELLEQNQ